MRWPGYRDRYASNGEFDASRALQGNGCRSVKAWAGLHLESLGPRAREVTPLLPPSTLEFFELGLGRPLTADFLGDCRRNLLALLARESALSELSSHVVPEPRPVAALSLHAAEIC